MSEVTFEDNDFHIRSRRLLGAPETPTMIKLLLKYRLAKNEKHALYILIGVVVLFLSVPLGMLIHNSLVDDVIVLPNGQTLTAEKYVKDLRGRGN